MLFAVCFNAFVQSEDIFPCLYQCHRAVKAGFYPFDRLCFAVKASTFKVFTEYVIASVCPILRLIAFNCVIHAVLCVFVGLKCGPFAVRPFVCFRNRELPLMRLNSSVLCMSHQNKTSGPSQCLSSVEPKTLCALWRRIGIAGCVSWCFSFVSLGYVANNA